jgi:hypothetical protein
MNMMIDIQRNIRPLIEWMRAAFVCRMSYRNESSTVTNFRACLVLISEKRSWLCINRFEENVTSTKRRLKILNQLLPSKMSKHSLSLLVLDQGEAKLTAYNSKSN